MLLDEEIRQIIEKELELYFSINNTLEVSPHTIWEAHKSYIRGVLIKKGTERKKQREKQTQEILHRIHNLESLNNKRVYSNMSSELQVLREELRTKYICKRQEIH